MTSLCSRFRRLKDQLAQRRLARLVIIRDSRSPIPSTAKMAKQYLGELQDAGAVVRHPSIEALAALDALRSLLSDAKSGNLAFEGKAVLPTTIEEWLSKHLPESLFEWFGDFGDVQSHGGADTVEMEELATLLVERHVMAVDDAAQVLNRSAEKVSATIQRHPDHFGLLAGSPAVVFQITNA